MRHNLAEASITTTANMDVVDLTVDSSDNEEVVMAPEVVRAEVYGRPKALPRMRHFRNGFYNPARTHMAAFRLLDGMITD